VELRTQFSTELERAREQVSIAQERAEASERRALRARSGAHRAAAERAQRRAERAGAEAALARQLLAELRVAPREQTGARRKAGGQGPIANEEPGAPALPLNPHDGNDGDGN
jgi:hypothetical protein